jgi:O-acetyl-ADP-ribose deacetylase (regulator of RNase III)
MIETARGDILHADAEALVNTVNCVGFMGRGIALQFRKAYPENFASYKKACDANEVQPGRMHVVKLHRFENPKYVINFPTKRHWKGKSRIDDVKAGLHALVEELRSRNIRSVAIPPLGCGLGGLDWNEVRPLIETAMSALPDVKAILFEPAGAPQPDEMVKQASVPRMTSGRAALLGLMRRYLGAVLDPWITLLEIHKLMYFMQASGEKLRLNFSKGPYGPYAQNLRHVLSLVEGHFILGFGDAEDDPSKQIEPLGSALHESEKFLEGHQEVHERFNRVAKLIDGFETPYGMELLATVHWVATQEGAASPEETAQRVHAWSDRKKRFPRQHTDLAWKVLRNEGWLDHTCNIST